MIITPEQIEGFNGMARAAHQRARAHGWHDGNETEDQYVTRACPNIHGEVSELWEAHRAHQLHSPCDKAQKMADAGIPTMTCAEEELADIVIRAMDAAERLGVNLGLAVANKHAFNGTRPYRHGGKKA